MSLERLIVTTFLRRHCRAVVFLCSDMRDHSNCLVKDRKSFTYIDKLYPLLNDEAQLTMFDMSFLEIVIIAIVSLLVLGPERLPGTVRTGALYVGRIKRSIKRLRDEIENEIGAKEIRAVLVDDSALKIERDLADLKKNYYRGIDYASNSGSLKEESVLEKSSDDGDSDLLQHTQKNGVQEL